MHKVSRNPVDAAAARLRQNLGEAAGEDRLLSRDEVEAKLELLAPSERKAVDGFYSAVRSTLGAADQIPLDTLYETIEKTRIGLIAGADGGKGLTADENKQLSGAGAAFVGLARKLKGERGAVMAPVPRERLAGLNGDDLSAAIRQNSARHVELDYRQARQVMFGTVDNKDGLVRGVYTGREIRTQGIPNANGPDGMNTEHTRPKSKGVRDTPALSDLHHLFPTDSRTNGRRSSFPFGEVVDVKWQNGDSMLGLDASGQMVFEPPDAHKGDVARSQFYVSTIYDLPISAAEEAALRSWSKLDPVTDGERQRNDAISAFQENRNPFVDQPELADRIDDF